ncbi:hypothetical protein VTP01DRAFT_5105 [Rhizomucor pusillus]|uniref:uncharacterized protein n=1 Tax=Rhizomucor pusillus TaxID=4840 RepID=UPI00374405C9
MSQVDNDGFTVVERKFKYLNVNADKNGRRKRKGRYKFQDPDDYTVSDLRSILDQQSETLVQSKFFSDLHDIFERRLEETYDEIVCYGIGSMQHSKNAQFQYALILLIRERLKSPPTYIYDPVMTELDKKICKQDNINVIPVNEEGKRKASKRVLFYMPHCGRGLYSNTLEANWSIDDLPNVTIIGNRFDMYVGSQLDKDLRRECPYLIPAVKVVERTLFPENFEEDDKVFSDLSIQTFPKDKLLVMKPSFWEKIHRIEGEDNDLVKL